MRPLRRAAQADKNEKEIVKALRQIPNVTVAVGHDDILVGHTGKDGIPRTYWFEIKNPKRMLKDGTVPEYEKKESQIKLEKTWKGHYKIVSTLKEILNEIGIRC